MSTAGTVFVFDHDFSLLFELRESAGDQLVEFLPWGSLQQPVVAADSTQQSTHDLQCLLVMLSALPGGMDELERLCSSVTPMPVVAISSDSSVQAAVAAIHSGAAQYVVQPASMDTLWREIESAFNVAQERRQQREQEVAERLKLLSEYEYDVLTGIAAGHSNREMAQTFDMSVRGIEHRRSRISRKLQVSSSSELVALAKLLAGPDSLLRSDAACEDAV
ncbi:MAG: LuxR C-terminal-related transcriptional regulator [Planctomycetota bacterium]|nr:LuxR C-terminal-related transcriptional regulator [Planctomycetota bacterium]